MMGPLVTGVNGLVGSSLARRLVGERRTFVGLGRGPARNHYLGDYPYVAADLQDAGAVRAALNDVDPVAVLHAGAMTAVDRCEVERRAAYRTNVEATATIAEWCAERRRLMIYLSTDYVFDGRQGPYREDAPLRPLGVYAHTKAAGELAVQALLTDYVIARTAVPFGDVPNVRKDFVRWLVEELRAKRPVRVVTDQLSNPTYADDLAAMLLTLAGSSFRGIVHTAGATSLSRYDFALLVARIFGLDADLITPIKTTDLAQASPRPLDARLDVSLARELGLPLSFLDTALARLGRNLAQPSG